MGTAGGVMKALKYIDDTFFVLSGDVLIDLDLNKLLKFHREKKAIATIVLTEVDDPTHYGIAVLDEDDQIVKFLEKPSTQKFSVNWPTLGHTFWNQRYLITLKLKRVKLIFQRICSQF
jgi:mannose-1-phosphate guanylyltransferase